MCLHFHDGLQLRLWLRVEQFSINWLGSRGKIVNKYANSALRSYKSMGSWASDEIAGFDKPIKKGAPSAFYEWEHNKLV